MAIGAPREVREEGVGGGADSAIDADGEEGEAEVGWEGRAMRSVHTVFVAPRGGNDGTVGSEARGVRVRGSNVGGAARVKRLHLNQGVDVRCLQT